MNPADLDRIRASRGFPSVSILFPTHLGAPGSKEDHIRLRNLLNDASERLAKEAKKADARKVMQRLEKLAGEVRPESTLRGMGLFSNLELSVKIDLPFAVPERVVVDDTFATRDLVSILNRTPRYWVLAIAEKGTRIFRGTGSALLEADVPGFPAVQEPLDGVKGHSKHPDDDRREEDQILFLQQVEKKFAEVAKKEPRPLVVAGVKSHLAHFRQVLGDRREILATVEGSHARTPTARLAKLVWPAVEEALRKRTGPALQDLEKAVHARKYASGIVETWRAAREGRIAELLVEDGYRQPARADGDSLTVVEGPEGPDVIDDAVDEVIEAVLDKGGRVVFVGKGALKAHQSIGAVLRY